MIKLKLKYEILVSGLYPFDGEFTKNDFLLQKNFIDDEIFKQIYEFGTIYISPYLGFCTYPDNTSKKATYLTFVKEKIIDIELLSSDLSNTDLVNTKLAELNLFDEIEALEKILTLQINNPIKFPLKSIKVYDLQDNFITINSIFANINIPSLLSVDEKMVREKLERQNIRLSFGFSYEKIIELSNNNPLFSRALSLYYESFSVCDEKVGFILLITALETLLSLSTYSEPKHCELCNQLIYKITSSVSTNVNLILMCEDNSIKKDMGKKYRQRSNYVHGEAVLITQTDYQELQEYVRKVLLMYWHISTNIQKSEHKLIVDEFQNDNYSKNISYKTFLEVLHKQSFQQTHQNIFQQILNYIKNRMESNP